MKRALPVIINCSGAAAAELGDRLADTVTSAFDVLGQAITLQLVDGDQIEDAVRRHVGAPVVAVGGGDGTLAVAAKTFATSPTAMAILPLGARNALARRLGVPGDLEQAAAVCVRGQRRRIDLGVAGDRIFLGSVAFGAAATFAAAEADRKSGWRRPARAAWRALRAARAQRYGLRVDGDARSARSSWLAVTVNPRAFDPVLTGEREIPAAGGLTLCAAAKRRPIVAIAAACRALCGARDAAGIAPRFIDAREIVIERAPEIGGEIEIALDGEVTRAALPLTLRNLPGALGFISPRELDLCEMRTPLAHHY